MKIEIGAYYRARNGETVGPIEEISEGEYVFARQVEGRCRNTYNCDGLYHPSTGEMPYDLIEQIPAPDEIATPPLVPTLDEAAAQIATGEPYEWDKRPGDARPIGEIANGVVSALRPADINETLAERGDRYGDFTEHARITQAIKAAMADSPNWNSLAPDQREALEMIAHKAGRILNGDPDYHDSWHDIVGYTKLVADRLVA